MDELDRLGYALLLELAVEPTTDCARKFDALYYEIVWKSLRANYPFLGQRVARYLRQVGTIAPHVRPEEADEIAHEATKLALRRVRENAGRFDPAKGTPTVWVIGAAEYAFIEVAKAISKARRSSELLFVSPELLHGEPDPKGSPEEQVLQRFSDEEALGKAASHLTEKELVAIRMVLTAGYSYRETAERIFGNASLTKQVDGLLTRAKRKLAEAWESDRSIETPARRMIQDPIVGKEELND